MTTTSQPPEPPQVKGGNATLRLYGVEHFQRMGSLSAAKRKQQKADNDYLNNFKLLYSHGLCPSCGVMATKMEDEPWKCMCQLIFGKPCPFNQIAKEANDR